jgi:hypothetical protein
MGNKNWKTIIRENLFCIGASILSIMCMFIAVQNVPAQEYTSQEFVRQLNVAREERGLAPGHYHEGLSMLAYMYASRMRTTQVRYPALLAHDLITDSMRNSLIESLTHDLRLFGESQTLEIIGVWRVSRGWDCYDLAHSFDGSPVHEAILYYKNVLAIGACVLSDREYFYIAAYVTCLGEQ